MTSESILIIDDDGEAALALSKALKGKGLAAKSHIATTEATAITQFQSARPLVVVLDLSLNERGIESGFSVLKTLQSKDPTTRIIILTGHGTKEHGIRAIKEGASSFLEKPPHPEHLKVLIEDGIRQAGYLRAYETLKASPVAPFPELGAKSNAAKKLLDELQRASISRQPVLLLGETGTGKGFCARKLHLASKNPASFIRYQPTFASPDLVNSDLFGHTKGAFTGALENKRGLLSEVGEGTFFLDEIEALPLETQVALLGVFQEKVFRPVGSTKEETASFRLITASNGDIERDIETGKLRRDFYHRVAHVVIKIPPLRERVEDIEELAKAQLEYLAEHEGLLATEIEESALSLLRSYEWPGNIRELHAAIEAGAWRAQYEGRRSIGAPDLSFAKNDEREAKSFHEKVEAFKRKLISEALLRNDGSKERAAQELGIDRTTMWRTLERAK
jgi:DNA-binding NtrC family response regulator